MGVVAALVLVVGWKIWPASTGADITTFRQLYAELERVHGLQKNNNVSAWAVFLKEQEKKSPPLIKELEKKASSEYPARQQLLSAARLLPEMAKKGAAPKSIVEQRFDNHLRIAAQLLKIPDVPDPVKITYSDNDIATSSTVLDLTFVDIQWCELVVLFPMVEAGEFVAPQACLAFALNVG